MLVLKQSPGGRKTRRSVAPSGLSVSQQRTRAAPGATFLSRSAAGMSLWFLAIKVALYCADDQTRTVNVAEFPLRGGSCGDDHGSGIHGLGSAGTGPTVTQRLRHCRRHETLSAKRQLPGVPWLGG